MQIGTRVKLTSHALTVAFAHVPNRSGLDGEGTVVESGKRVILVRFDGRSELCNPVLVHVDNLEEV